MKNWLGKMIAGIAAFMFVAMFVFVKPESKPIKPGGVKTLLGYVYPSYR